MAKRTAVAAVTACALFALVPATAAAHRFNARTTADITSGGPTGAEGTVSSPKVFCERNRRVELFRQNEVDPDNPMSFGTDVTDRSGNWRVDADLFAGNYYVTVTPKPAANASKKKKKRHRHRCRGTTSAPESL
jgi:hypothetical protein